MMTRYEIGKCCGYIWVFAIALLIPAGLRSGQNVSKADFVDEATRRVWIYLGDDPDYDKYFKAITFPEKTRRHLNETKVLSKKISDDRIPGDELRGLLSANTIKLRYYSRFLKAYSAEIDSAGLARLMALPIVDRVELVGFNVASAPPDAIENANIRDRLTKTQTEPWKKQLSQINIPPVHALGITGRGVRIGIIDTGFFKDHEVFSDIVSSGRLIAEYDFINDDENVGDEGAVDVTNGVYQSKHGTAVWGIIGGYYSQNYIGVAPGAEFLLAKTEREGTEIRQEEDDFVAAVEWCDYWGADIISVSLSYRDFTGGFEYSWEELDGKTAVTTRIINWAFERGILCVCSVGNEALNGRFSDGGIITPGDAFGALTIGAVDSLGQIASFSSYGPTVDGRIKPDLCAMGVSTYVVGREAGAYYFSDGTSYSTPLIAGSAALLLESQPTLTPSEIITELKRYANRTTAPDNKYGWGIPDVYQSIVNYQPAGFPENNVTASQILVYPNPAQSYVNLYFIWHKAEPPTSDAARLQVFNLLGQKIYEQKLPSGYLGKKEIFTWYLSNFKGGKAPNGIYFVRLTSADYLKTGKFLIVR